MPVEDSEDDSSASEKVEYNAMILPCPVSGKDGKIILIDLSNKKDFSFSGLDKCFPTLTRLTKGMSKAASKNVDYEQLEVIELGAYKVSIAPTARDIRRANKDIFKVSKGTRRVLKEEYDDGFAFVICMFDSTKEIEPHPIGYVHDVLPSSGKLFVPCKHVHDGKAHNTEHFDHVIYSLDAQDGNMESVDGLTEEYKKLEKKGGYGLNPADNKVDKYLTKTRLGKYLTLDEKPQLYRQKIVGDHKNTDMSFALDSVKRPAAAKVTKPKSRKDSESDNSSV